MNKNLYIEERIEDIYQDKNSDEVDAIIIDLLEKNLTLHEEVRKLKREQEIQLVRLCEVLEEKNKIKEELEGKNNEIQYPPLQQIDFINQLTNANEEIKNLRIENESLKNDLDTEKKIN